MKNYKVNYRTRGNKGAHVYETMVCADNIKEAKKDARIDLNEEFVIISVKLEK